MNSRRGQIRLWQLLALIVVIGSVVSLLMPSTDQGRRKLPRAEKTPRESPRAAVDLDKIQLSIGGRADLEERLSQRRGQVVLVDFWALWCEPCVENFPHLVELGRQNSERGLAIVTVNMDAPQAAEKTLEFLKSQRAGIASHLISQFGGGSQSMEAFEIPGGALPCYKLYDRTGRLRHTFALDPAAKRQFALQELDASVEMLLAE